MKNCDFVHGPSADGAPTQVGTRAETHATTLAPDLANTQPQASCDPVDELDFVIALIDQLEAVHKADPEQDVSLSVEGAWTATLEIIANEDDDGDDVQEAA